MSRARVPLILHSSSIKLRSACIMFWRKICGFAPFSRISGITPAAAAAYSLQRGDVSLLTGNNNQTSAICTATTTTCDSAVFAHIKFPKQLERALAEKYELGFDNPADAVALFDRMVEILPYSTTDDFNELFKILVRFKSYPNAIYLIKRLRVFASVPIDQFTLNILLNCYCRLDRLHYGFSIIGSFIKLGYEPHQAPLTALMIGLIGEDKIYEALELRNRFIRKRNGRKFDVVTGAATMNALFKVGEVSKAVRVVNGMLETRAPIMYETIINGLCNCGQVDSAINLSSMDKLMFTPTACTLNSFINGFANLGRWADLKMIIPEMRRRGITPDRHTFYVLMDILGHKERHSIYAMLKDPETDHPFPIRPVINKFRPPRAIILAGICFEDGDPLKYILEVWSENVNVGLVAYNTLMKRYCLDGRVGEAAQVFHFLATRRIHRNILSYNILINGFCNKSKLDEALQLYREIPHEGLVPNRETYNSLLKGLLIAGRCSDAEGVFLDMVNRGIKTDMLTYSTLLNSLCSNGGPAEGSCKPCKDAGEIWYKWLKPDFCLEEIVNEAEKLLVLDEYDYLTNEDVLLANFIAAMGRRKHMGRRK